jgi:tape measure domain-containing protein
MSSIDERIVQMRFNNQQFQKGVKETNDSLGDLKKSLDFKGATRSLGNLDLATKNVSLSGLASSIDNIATKFTTMSVIGITALATITTKAIEAGGTIAKKLFIDPAKSGLSEYETNINSIQTILANTSAKGTTLDQVNKALQDLNTYSDKTIYNFAQMARNIGTFTAAGVDLKTATGAIKGIANLAAVSGSSADQASTAMYQLSQAISTGSVKLMDWNSVVNAGMGGEVFQDALKRTARAHGVAVDAIIKKNGSFRDSLQDGWLTARILTDTLAQFTGDLSDSQLKQMGFTSQQIKDIQKLAKTAVGAASDVKTFSQLMDTLGEATTSGWSQTWQIVLGDFGEAKTLFTLLSNTFGGLVQASANARNKMLQDWKNLGGRKVLIEALTNVFKALVSVFEPIHKAFREIFPATTGKQLYDMTVAFRNFTRLLILGTDASYSLYQGAKFLFNIFKIGIQIIGGIFGVLFKLIGAIFDGGKGIASAGKGIGDFFQFLNKAVADTRWIPAFFETLGNALLVPLNFVKAFVGAVAGGIPGFFKNVSNALMVPIDLMKLFAATVKDVVLAMAGFTSDGITIALTRITERIKSLGRLGQAVIDIWNDIKRGFEALAKFLQPVTDAFGKMFKDIGANIKDALKDVSFSDVLDLINVGLVGAMVLIFNKFVNGFGKDVKKSLIGNLKEITEGITGILSGVTDTLKAMQTNLKAGTLVKIAGAIALLTASVLILSLIDSAALTKALVALTIMFTQMAGTMAVFGKIAAGPNIAQVPVMAFSLILLATAVNILATAVKKLSELSWQDLIKGLVGVVVLLGAVTNAAKGMSGNAANLIATGIGMIAVAFAVKILASAVKDLSDIGWNEMIKGLIGVGTLLAALAIFNRLTVANKSAIVSGVGLILLGTAIKILASAVKDFATMDVGQIVQGVAALSSVLLVLSVFTKAISGAKGMVGAAVGLLILGGAVKIIASALKDFASMSWEELTKGLLAMGGALLLITAAMLAMPPSMIVTAAGLVLVAAALKIIASALKDMGGMSWEEIGKSMVVLAGSLIILAGAMYLMTAALPGAAALLIVAGALAILTPALLAMAHLSWDQIGRGLTMLAGVFLVIGVAGLVLTPLVPVLLGLGIAIGLIGIGIGAAGVGILAFAVGLTLLAAAGLAAIPVVIALVTAILNLIPMAMQKLGEGIAAFAKVIGDSAPLFLDAMVKLIMTLLTAIDTVAPKIIDTLVKLIFNLLDALVKVIPKFVDAGMKIISGVLKGIADNIGNVIKQGTNIVVNFLNGIANSQARIIQAGINLVIKFIEGLAKGIRDNTQRMYRAAADLGNAILDGLTGGLWSGVNRVINAAAHVAQSALDSIAHVFDSHSPSKKAIMLGGFVSKGLAIGITKLSNEAEKAAVMTATKVVNGLTKVLSHIDEFVNQDLKSPVITPTLDMSALKRDAGQITGILASPKLTAKDSLILARATLADAQANLDARNKVIEENRAAQLRGMPAPVQFIQNNNSPKALPKAEIYRQTQNLLSGARKVVTPEGVATG